MFLFSYAKGALVANILLIVLGTGFAFNVDTEHAIVFSGTKGSYFGYTTALYYNKQGPLVLVGAPKSNTSTFSNALRSVYQPGTVFRCNITTENREKCQEVPLMKEGAEERSDKYSYAYQDLKDGMWLGVSLDVSRARNDIVACGHLWRNQYYSYLKLHMTNGVCYVINGDLDTDSIKLLPLTERRKQYTKVGNSDEYNHAHGQAGISAVFSEDGSSLILGAPGIWSWTGSIVDYSIQPGSRRSAYTNPVIPSSLYVVNYGSYFGYSVTTGKFFRSEGEMYAVGAPRDAMNYGKVYVVILVHNDLRIRVSKKGFQLGEYFGAVVLGMDLNGDSLTDLLVGAPTNSKISGGDEGKVYVYMSNGKDLIGSLELTGDSKPFSRFGTSLANAGDINQDGYDDVAVGAPYEDDRGAIYIYHCSKSGIKPAYAQKIAALEVSPALSGFGIHISRGLDIDQNGYPDLVVGSYHSSHAVLFRSRPVIRVFPEIVFTPKLITMRKEVCSFGDKFLTCVQVKTCLWYSGKNVPTNLEFAYTVSTEDGRGFFSKDGQSKSSKNWKNAIAIVNRKMCSEFWMYLRETTGDFLTPIPVHFSSDLAKYSAVEQKFNKSFPIYHPSTQTDITAEIPFHIGCGKENVCHSNLIVTATRTYPPGGGVLILGEFYSVSVTATVRNEGEPAYLSKLRISLPKELPSISMRPQSPVCTFADQRNDTYISCDVGNPLKSGSQSQFEVHLKLDATVIPPLTKYLEIRFQAETKSTDTYPDDNEEVLALHLKTVAELSLSGQPSHDQITYDGKKKISSLIKHTYTIRNHGPSPLRTVNFQLRVPYAFVTADGVKPFLYLDHPKVEHEMHNTIPADCDISKLSGLRTIQNRKEKIMVNDESLPEDEGDLSAAHIAENLVLRPSELTDVQPDINIDAGHEATRNESELIVINAAHSINCDFNEEIECVTLQCSAGHFINLRRFAQISIDMELDFDVLNEQLEQWYQVEFVTTGSASVPELNNQLKIAHVRTVAIHEGPPPAEQVQSWIIFVGVGGGVLLLLIILIILIKVGFFRRKEKDKMKALQSDTKKQGGNVEPDIKDTEVLTQ